ncbi:MAG: O-methyltransferase [Chloroflexi bacterium]|nr:O-methyltransferase [Chloroflexota bacterium]
MKSTRDWLPTATDLDWIESASPVLHPSLVAIEKDAVPDNVPILDRASGRVLAALAADRRRIVEVGTAIGYSTLWMALGQPDDGTIVTIDPDLTRTLRARVHWRSAGIGEDRITVVNAPALEAFRSHDPALEGPFDMAFIDALKPEYGGYLEAIAVRIEPGAIVVADNVLWGGRVSGARKSQPGDGTRELRAFCEHVLSDPRFNSTILPVGDGLLLAVHRG